MPEARAGTMGDLFHSAGIVSMMSAVQEEKDPRPGRYRMRRTSRLFAYAALALAVVPGRGTAQVPSIPDTPAGRQATALLALLEGGGDDDSVRAFVQERFTPEFRDGFPMEAHVATFRRLRTDLVGAQVRGVDTRGPYTIQLALRNRDGSAFRLEIEVVSDAPYRIAMLGVSASPGAGGPPSGPRPAEADLLARVQLFADSLVAVDRFSGVILVARGDTPVLQRAWGLADRDRGIANTVDTRFNMGSINKIFTAAAIHRLAGEGRLGLADTLGALLPEYPDASARRQVTVRHLLEHRSGIGGNIFRAPDGGTRDDLRTTADFLNLFAGEPLRFTPGSRSEYSNAGYVVLGAIIERLSGRTYYEYVHDHIYRPLGMSATAHYHRASLPAGIAIGYTRRAGPLGSNHDLLPGRGSSAGGGYTTAGDLLRFALAAERGEVPGVRGGLGIGGGAPGINAILETGLPGGYHLIVLANMDPPVAEDIGERVREWLGAR